MSLYFILLLVSIFIPFSLSFDKKLRFYKKWKFVLPALTFVAFVYIVFDVYLTKQGVWGFNPAYISKVQLFNLPIEECLFFIVIPYASIFLHYSFVLYLPKIKLPVKATRWLTIVLILFIAIAILFNYDKVYTTYIFSKLVLVLAISFFDKSKTSSSFFITFLLVLVPFLIINGILTGSFIENEVVWYNNEENLGLRVFTIPIEDFAYAFSLILFNLLLISGLQRMFKSNKVINSYAA